MTTTEFPSRPAPSADGASPYRIRDEARFDEARKGPQDALDLLWRQHQPGAYRYALRLCKTPDLASDLVSEAFLRAIERLATCRDSSSFAAWLRGIIRNYYVDGYRRAQRFPNVPIDVPRDTGESATRELEDDGPLPDEAYSSMETGRLVRNAVGKLSSSQRDCVVMYYLEEKGVDDVAKCLNVPPSTVKTRLHRARQQLKQSLWQLEESSPGSLAA